MTSVRRGLRQSSNFADQFFPADLPRFVHTFSFGQLGDRRPASHHWDTTLGAKPNIRDALAPTFEAKSKFENVSADRVLQARATVGRLDFTRVARTLEMV